MNLVQAGSARSRSPSGGAGRSSAIGVAPSHGADAAIRWSVKRTRSEGGSVAGRCSSAERSFSSAWNRCGATGAAATPVSEPSPPPFEWPFPGRALSTPALRSRSTIRPSSSDNRHIPLPQCRRHPRLFRRTSHAPVNEPQASPSLRGARHFQARCPDRAVEAWLWFSYPPARS